MAIANSVDLTTVTRLYTAFFNRAPDTAGLSFWADALANGASVTTVTQGFLTAPEGVSQYPAFQSAEQFVSAFYSKVFGRAADAEGLAFWTAALNNLGGAESIAAKAALASQIISVVSTPLSDADAAANPDSVKDRAIFANKVEVGTYFAVNGALSIEQASTLLNGVTEDISTVDDKKSAFFTDQINNGSGNVVGTDGNDVFTISNLTGYVGRTLDGGKGTDTLVLNNLIGTPADNQVKNVEIIRFEFASGTADVSKFLGSTDIVVSNAGVSLSGLAGKALGFVGIGSSVEANYGDTATTAAISLKDAAVGPIMTLAVPSTNSISFEGSKLTSATITGSGSLIVDSAPDALTTLNVASTGTIAIAATSSVTTIDASASTGAVTAMLGANQAYKGGSGVDTVTLFSTPSKAIDGGAGDKDVLVVDGTAEQVVLNAGITGFETLGFGSGASGEYDVSNFKHLLVSNNVNGPLTVNQVAAGTDVSFTRFADLTYNLATDTASDAVAVTVSASGTSFSVQFAAAGIETVNITSANTGSGSYTNGISLLADAATSIVVTGNSGLQFGEFSAAKVTNLDASALTGENGVIYTSTNETANASVTIKGSLTGANTLEGNDLTNDTIVGGAGEDLIRGTAGKDVLTGGAGDDIFFLARNESTVTGGSSLTFTTITDATKGDLLYLANLSTNEGFSTTTLTQVTSVETATYADLLELAVQGDATDNGAIGSWFQFSGDTYIVVDNSALATFAEGTDQVVKLTGLVDITTLNIELIGLG